MVLAVLGMLPLACAPAGPPREMAFVSLPPGELEIGCTEGQLGCEDDEVPHLVTLTQGYRMSETEVTRGQFAAALGYDPSAAFGCGQDCPVESVTWSEAAAFANALSEEEGEEPCYACTGSGRAVECAVSVPTSECAGFRLPTEAEWEAAARCGTDLPFAGSAEVDEVAWYAGNSGGGLRTVGLLAPNDCGLFDMSGNVWEWTQDIYGAYPSDPVTDPLGPAQGEGHVNRGGSWHSIGTYTHVAERHKGGLEATSESFGFRVAASER